LLTVHRHECEDQPDVAQVEQRLGQQGQGDGPGSDRGGQVEPAPVDRVGDRATVDAEDDDRHQAGEPHEAHVERRVRQGVDLHRHGHLGEHRADERRALTDEQPAVRSDRERPGVDNVPTEQAGPTAATHGPSRSITHASPSRR
jgi:hypothetical protein